MADLPTPPSKLEALESPNHKYCGPQQPPTLVGLLGRPIRGRVQLQLPRGLLQLSLEDSEPPAGPRSRAEEPAEASLEWPDDAKRGRGGWGEVGGGFRE